MDRTNPIRPSQLISWKPLRVVLIFFISFDLRAQDHPREFSVGLGAGIDLISFRDVSASPLAYAGFGLPVALQFKIKSERFTHRLDVSLISTVLTNNYSLTSTANTQLLSWDKMVLNYQLLKTMSNGITRIGPSLRNQFFYREYDFLDGQSWEFIGSLNIDVEHQIAVLENVETVLRASVPLIGFLHRQTALTLDEQFLDDLEDGNSLLKYGEWRPNLNDWVSIQLSMTNTIPLNDRLNLELEVAFQYYQISFPEKVSNINYPVLCRVQYLF